MCALLVAPTWTAVVRASGEVALVEGYYAQLGAGEACAGTFQAISEADAWALFTAANPLSQSSTTMLGMDPKTHRVHPDAVTRLRVPIGIDDGWTDNTVAFQADIDANTGLLAPRSQMVTITSDSDQILAVEADEASSRSRGRLQTMSRRQTKNAKGRKR